MGDFATSSTTSSANANENSASKTDPWKPQAKYLKDAMGNAQGIYNDQAGKSYNGEFVAGFNPQQLDQFNKMLGYANSSQIGNQLASQGSNLMGLGQAGVGAGMQGLSDFRPTGSTQGMIDDAGRLADNPYMSSMVDAATRDARRATYEGQLPANARAAAMGGNSNSSKRFMGDAIAERGLADRVADVSAGLRGNAYQQGLGLSQNQSQFNDNAMLDRAKGLGGLGLDAANSGANAMGGSLEAMKALFGLGNEGAAGLQAADQAKIDNELQKYGFNKDDAWATLNNYYNIIGGQNWGSQTKGNSSTTQTGTGTSTASPAATAGGLLTSIGSLIPGK